MTSKRLEICPSSCSSFCPFILSSSNVLFWSRSSWGGWGSQYNLWNFCCFVINILSLSPPNRCYFQARKSGSWQSTNEACYKGQLPNIQTDTQPDGNTNRDPSRNTQSPWHMNKCMTAWDPTERKPKMSYMVGCYALFHWATNTL